MGKNWEAAQQQRSRLPGALSCSSVFEGDGLLRAALDRFFDFGPQSLWRVFLQHIKEVVVADLKDLGGCRHAEGIALTQVEIDNYSHVRHHSAPVVAGTGLPLPGWYRSRRGRYWSRLVGCHTVRDMAQEPHLPLGPIGIWTGTLDIPPAAEAQQLAAELEELGYAAVWLPEVAGRDVILHLGLLLSATQRLVGATGIASIYARDAVTMTGGVKGLTEAFPERVLLGLGVSHHTLVQELRGHEYDKPLAAMTAYLDALDASPYTASRPTTPVHRALAALGPRMLALAAARSDGAHTYFVTPEHTAAARKEMGAGPAIYAEQAVLLETDPTRAREISREHTAVYLRLPNYQNNLRRLGFADDEFGDGGSDRLVDAIVAWGDEEAISGRVQAHFEAGADHVCIQPLPAARREVPAGQWRTLAPAMQELASALSQPA